MITNDRLYRSFDYALSDQQDYIIEGVPVVFNTETILYEADGFQIREMIDANAFNGANMSDVVLVVDHAGRPMARTKNGSLDLQVRNDGLHMRADVSVSELGRTVYPEVKGGLFDKMSFAFTVAEEEYIREKSFTTRIIKRIDTLFDVSIVTRPAYEQTSVVARSFAEAEVEARRKALEEAELRERLILMTEF
jgi:HK97 family phage prohead protease